MNFEPKSAKEIADSQVLPGGEYPFQVLAAEEKKSQKGNDMIELDVEITRDGQRRLFKDYLLPSFPAKLRSCCIACKLEEKYDLGKVSAGDFLGKQGRLKLGIERPKNGYPRRNVIKDYLA